MLKKYSFFLILFAVFLTGSVKPALAVSTPDFGSCANPKVAASQVNTGNNHGVVGQAKAYAGVDKIYNLSNGNVLQCLCPNSGTGIQTNWYKASKLSDSDIKVLKKQGWIYVATGYSWGLEDVSYLAKNSDYACRGTVLAATGNSLAIYGLIFAGAVSLATGLFIRRRARSK